MFQLGYALSCEEHDANTLVRNARLAEESGFDFATISDHFHPWVSRQGHSPFVWSVLGGIAQQTRHLQLGTGVTCPTMRAHPAIIAQAAATVATLMPDRFFLGLGTGENLNEHVTGRHWPRPPQRLEMLEEAIEVIRLLWQGGFRSHRGRHYVVENARLYDLPDQPPPIFVAATGEKATQLAGRTGDGLIALSPDPEQRAEFDRAGEGRRRPAYGMTHVCWAKDEAEGRRTLHQWWPNAAIGGSLFTDLPTPVHFEEVAELVTEEQVCRSIPCGNDPEQHAAAISKFIDAGFDGASVHQVGPDQEEFLSFFELEVMPRLRSS